MIADPRQTTVSGFWYVGALFLTCALPIACDGGGNPDPDPDPPRADSIALSPDSVEFDALNDTSRVSANVLDQYGDPMPTATVVWASDNPLVASVDQTGLITSEGDGETTVRAQAGAKRSSVNVEVAQEAGELVVVEGDGQRQWTGFPLRDPLLVRLTDKAGTPVVGAELEWEILEGEGEIFPESNQTNEDGEVSATWVLGAGEGGTQLLSVTFGELDPVEFEATGSAPLTLLSAEPLTTRMLDTLSARLLARDSLGVPDSGIPVEFQDITGFGEIVQGPSTTDVNGELEVHWALGPTPGPQRVTVVRSDIDADLELTAEATGTLDPWPFTVVSPGFDHTCALLTGNEAYCWGRNLESQLALEDTLPVTWPVEIPSARTWQQIDSGDEHTCALTLDGGGVYCWGTGFQVGLDGDGTQVAESPTRVDGGPWAALTTGATHNCAIQEDDASAWCWGIELEGRLGNGTMDTISVPALVQGGHAWTQLSAGHFHTCGITSTGEAYCWGRGTEGQLGNGGITNQGAPVLVAGERTWARISSGAFHTCGVTTSGGAYCWGGGDFGRLGSGSSANQTSPVRVGTRSWSTITAGVWHSCGVDSNDKLYCWGRGNGYIGLGPFGSSTPAVILPAYAWRSVRTQGFHTCATDKAGATYCWGPNGWGQLGIGNTEDSGLPRILVRDVF